MEPHPAIDYNDKYDEDDDTDKPGESVKSKNGDAENDDGPNGSTTKSPQTEGEVPESEQLQSQQQHQLLLQQQQQNLLASNPLDSLVKPWFFKNGDYYPKPAKVPKKRRGKKAHLQGSRLFPYQDPHSDRIVNQLMYVPPNYEEIKSSGKLKTILLYNGLGPWNIKAGKYIKFLTLLNYLNICSLMLAFLLYSRS